MIDLKEKKILVTGGAGFIGSEFVRQSIDRGYKVSVIDKLSYAADLERLKDYPAKYTFYKADICNYKRIDDIIKKEAPDTIIHFAAETHVDRSIQDIQPFIDTNITGTNHLIKAAIKNKIKKFIHISTDEIYGDSIKGKFKESSPILPNNPYSVTKAAAELLVKSAMRTYDLPAIIIRPANNYGPWQYPEKLVPVVILKALQNNRIPVYGKGAQIREWLHVQDCANAIHTIMLKGRLGEIYNVGTYFEKPNIVTVKTILKLVKRPEKLIQFVKDRPGHDFRYSVDYSKLTKLGWTPEIEFSDGIEQTVGWYTDNIKWLNEKLSKLEEYWKKVYKTKGII
jgi:dTDP-glucose 4,6-dehydratase